MRPKAGRKADAAGAGIELAEAWALIMWMADLLLALSKLPRSVLSSIAITWPSVASWIAWIQLSRQRSNSVSDSIRTTGRYRQ